MKRSVKKAMGLGRGLTKMNGTQFLKVLDILNSQYPKWQAPVLDLLAIETGDPFKILISTILSLRTKDQVTAQASRQLYAVAQDPQAMAKLSVKKIEQLIYPVGFYKTKAPQIKVICETLLKDYQGRVPDTLEELLQFKGVGRKTANLVLALGYNIPAICVDTHVHRINNRLGAVKTKTPEETEQALMQLVAPKYWNDINKLFVAFGQTICRPVGPKCVECKILNCPSRLA